MITRALGTTVALPSAGIRTARARENATVTIVSSANPVKCDPVNMSSHDTHIHNQSIHDTLRAQLGRALPDISKDRPAYTFGLRDDMLFQGGTPVTDRPSRVHVHPREPDAPWPACLFRFIGILLKHVREKPENDCFRQTRKSVARPIRPQVVCMVQ